MSQDTTINLDTEHDSNQLSPAQLPPPLSRPELQIISYGHSNGPLKIPTGAEHLNFSVRDIENPPAKLRRTHTGLSSRLRKEVMAGGPAKERLKSICTTVHARMEEMVKEERSDPLVVGIMCEEGKHRSVTFVEELSRRVRSRDWDIVIQHRDLGIVDSEDPGEMDVLRSGLPNTLSAKDSKSIAWKSKKQRDQERMKGRSSARKFVGGYSGEQEDED